jgi:hypothetical protein
MSDILTPQEFADIAEATGKSYEDLLSDLFNKGKERHFRAMYSKFVSQKGLQPVRLKIKLNNPELSYNIDACEKMLYLVATDPETEYLNFNAFTNALRWSGRNFARYPKRIFDLRDDDEAVVTLIKDASTISPDGEDYNDFIVLLRGVNVVDWVNIFVKYWHAFVKAGKQRIDALRKLSQDIGREEEFKEVLRLL